MWPTSLAREIAERRVLIFVGAGISKLAYDEFPTWKQLLTKLSADLAKRKDKELIKTLLRQGRALDAAQIIHDLRSAADLSAQLRGIFQIRPTPTHEIYRDLLDMDPKTIITTNYDELLEFNFTNYSNDRDAYSVSLHNQQKLLNDIRSPIRSILKIHGCISDPSTVILDRSSYFRARRDNPSTFSIVSSLMTVNTVLFLGYSINDPDIQLILENINLSSKADHPHYALMSKFEHSSIKNALKESYNISFIEYPSGQHDEAREAIAILTQKVREIRAQRGIV
ncbi:SIR2 family protein [Ancylobacter moscoviensis]